MLLKVKGFLPFFVPLALLAGCNSTDTAGGLSVSDANEANNVAAIVQGKCPRTSFREGTTFYRDYARGGDGDASKITYQASLADATRTCTINGDQLTVNVFAAGRLLAGPAGNAGDIQLPIRVAVIDKTTNAVLYSQLSQQVVTLTEPNLTAQFVFNDPTVTIPAGAGGETLVYIGFDTGPE